MANSFARMVQTIDSHTEGNSTRVIVGGRGHGMMCSVLLMPPIGDADFSIIIMEQDEYAVTLDGP